MGIVVLGVAIAELITKDEVEDLKRQINDIVDQHKQISDQMTRISTDLQKLDLQKLLNNLTQLNQNLSFNLQSIIRDQQNKLHMVRKIDPTRTTVDPQTLLSSLLEVLNFVSTVLTLVEVMCATNPVTIAVSGVLMVVNSVINVFGLVRNIQEIQELKKTKSQLDQYFKPGGQFEQDEISITILAFQLIQNFYMVVLNYRSMMNELAININLICLSQKSKELDYRHYLILLQSNPFDEDFEKYCLETYKNFIAIQGYELDEKVNMSCKYLEEFENSNNVIERIQMASQLAGLFSFDSDIGQQLQRASAQIWKLTRLKETFTRQFEIRKDIKHEELPEYDKELLKDLWFEARKMDERQLGIAEVVSFFTTEFFGDDPTGHTLFKMDLKQVYKSTEFLNYLGVNSKYQNLIYLPRPEDPALAEQWDTIKLELERSFQAQHHVVLYYVKNMYMRMELSQLQLNNKINSKLVYYYGLTIVEYMKHIEYSHEKEPIHLLASNYKKKALSMKTEKKERKQFNEENLDTLSKHLCFFTNGIAYPERITNFNIIKIESKYKAVLEWAQAKVKPYFFGKFIKYTLEEGQPQSDNEKEKILYAAKTQQDKWVVFRVK